MALELKGKDIFNGFILKEPLFWEKDLMIITGPNGCGKTRLFQSIETEKTICTINGNKIAKEEITFIRNAVLLPDQNDSFDPVKYESKITQSLGVYDNLKPHLDKPLELSSTIFQNRGRRGNDPQSDPLSNLDMFKLCLEIGNKVGKAANELTHEDIILHFDEPVLNLFTSQKLTAIINRYIKRIHKNEHNDFRKNAKKHDVEFLSKEEFELKFGQKPWVVLNEILTATFNGKFLFNEPDENSYSYNYRAQLIDQQTGVSVNNQYLSSGETTLYWLAMSLFNTVYFQHRDIVFPKLLLLDEPDSTLHPQMIVQMFDVLASFRKQFGTKIILSTHSPTTVALAPRDAIVLFENGGVNGCDQDTAISGLLKGVGQISIMPENRRQVYVESVYDARIYQALYLKLLKRSNKLDGKRTLTFISSGPKMPKTQITDKLKQLFSLTDEDKMSDFVEQINGVGNCDLVYGIVEALKEIGDRTSCGVVDWDKKNKPTERVKVLAEGHAYAIENVILDPIAVIGLLQTINPQKYDLNILCEKEIELFELFDDEEGLQKVTDYFIKKILGRENCKDENIEYSSGIVLKSDKEYLQGQGHGSEQNICNKFPELKRYWKQGKDGALKESIVTKSMINLTGGRLIPRVIEKLFEDLQGIS